ncbi:MAG: type II toxin-antitoxin system VapC family toxin [Verrucomicrobia bacterium]|nr:type II toxin-antitoxin system VapC family toxin [Verrucomicrobiota bacterium]
MIVADTVLIASFFLEIETSKAAGLVYDKDPIWIFPPIWREEYANVLAKIGSKDPTKSAEELIAHFEYTLAELKNNEREVHLSAVLGYALKYGISVYDAHFVKLAEDHDIMLVTEDREVLKKCPHRAVSFRDFV